MRLSWFFPIARKLHVRQKARLTTCVRGVGRTGLRSI